MVVKVDVLAGLPAKPPPALDPYLDAAARCFARYGVGRTSVQDIAKDLGVNRTTVYRQVGNVEQTALLLVSREVYRVLASLPDRSKGLEGPEALVELLATVIEECLAHPVLAKMLADERDMVGTLMAHEVPHLLRSVTDTVTPLVALTMSTGTIAGRDPSIVADWLARITASILIAPPRHELRRFLSELLIPALRP